MAGIYPLAPGERNPQQIVNAIRDIQQRASTTWPSGGITPITPAAPSLQPSMNGSIVLLGGNAFYDFTIGPVSGFPTDFLVLLQNDDTTRGKRIIVQGPSDLPPQFILWPKQSIFLYSTGKAGTWHSSPDVQKGGLRWKLDAATQFFINETLGSDLNDGLVTGAGAFASLTGAYIVIVSAVDTNGQTFTLQLDDGTVTDGLNVFQNWMGGGIMQVRGHVGNPALTKIAITSGAGQSGGNCIVVTSYPGGIVEVLDVQLSTTVPGRVCVRSESNSRVNILASIFDVATLNTTQNSNHMLASIAGAVQVETGDYTITGDASVHLGVNDGAASFVGTANVTLGGSGLRFFNNAFAICLQNSQLAFVSTAFFNAAGKQRQTTTGDTHSNTVIDNLVFTAPAVDTTSISVGMVVRGPNIKQQSIGVTGDTHGTTTLDNLSINTALLANGMTVVGADIPPNTTITILGANSVTLSNAATGSHTTARFAFVTTVASITGPNSITISNAATATVPGQSVKFEIAVGQKFLVQLSSSIYGQTGAGVDWLPGDTDGVATLGGTYFG